MNKLSIRITSAVITCLILIGLTYFLGVLGIKIFCILAAGIGVIEYYNLSLQKVAAPGLLKNIYLILSFLLLLFSFFGKHLMLAALGVALVTIISAALWTARNQVENEPRLRSVAFLSLGLVYAVFPPMLIISLVQMKNGPLWFLLLLLIVFTGDITAFFGGIFFGRSKLMPAISPNKTVAGAIYGLLGSLIAAIVFNYFYPHLVSLPLTIIVTPFAAALAQSGDLFESLLKRVADVKDSGRIMPGHGGVLDRLDGVYFAAPLVFALATYTNLQ